jgi:putative restriction endonuclease
MLIDGVQYTQVDFIEKITVADSCVTNSNKLGTGNGEAKLYVGNESLGLRNFFGPKGFAVDCFFIREELKSFLTGLQPEYKFPKLNYRQKIDLPELFDRRLASLTKFPEIIKFSIFDTQVTPPRVYINSKDSGYKLMRQISLPNLSYISVIKLASKSGKILFYMRLFSDFSEEFGEISHPELIRQSEEKINNSQETVTQKLQLIKSRIGQGKFRDGLLKECPFCPITMVGEDRLLIASHIKPWVDSNAEEKLDSKNGFMFTPTIDRLFDKGFITFDNDKKIKLTPWISNVTFSRLNLVANKTIEHLPIKGREEYLQYHRENIFKGSI